MSWELGWESRVRGESAVGSFGWELKVQGESAVSAEIRSRGGNCGLGANQESRGGSQESKGESSGSQGSGASRKSKVRVRGESGVGGGSRESGRESKVKRNIFCHLDAHFAESRGGKPREGGGNGPIKSLNEIQEI
jgi:hypothetical protein